MLLQPYLSSVETTGEISLIYFEGTLNHTVRKVPVPGDYRVQDDFGATDFPVEAPQSTEEIGAAAMAYAAQHCALSEPLLYGRVDLLQMDDGCWVLNELELIEPSLFFRHSVTAGKTLADALQTRLGGAPTVAQKSP